MGRKARLKKERGLVRQTNPEFLEYLLRGNSLKLGRTPDHEFESDCELLIEFLTRHRALDTIIAILTSELWLPNISSQVKHQFALSMVSSITPDCFQESRALDTYQEFRTFLEGLFRLLPSFHMLEDYVPEADWGHIKAVSEETQRYIFYGGFVERIPDFISAFQIRNAGKSAPLKDMDFTIRLQDHIISQIDSSIVGTGDDIRPGHIEFPTEAFWRHCRDALLSFNKNSDFNISDISCELVANLGEVNRPQSLDCFIDSFFKGSLVPVALKLADIWLPLSPRNSIAVVLELWEKRSRSDLDVGFNSVCERYVAERVGREAIIPGPLVIASRERRSNVPFSFAIISARKIYFVYFFEKSRNGDLKRLEQDIREIARETNEWALLIPGSRSAYLPASQDRTQPTHEDIEVISVISTVSAFPQSINTPSTSARFVWLQDFITIIDSLQEADELGRFWDYVDSFGGTLSPMSQGPADLFASFRDSHSLLLGGTTSPTLVSLDPHWGSNWRFEQLSKFWAAAPQWFPDGTVAWNIVDAGDDPIRITSKGTATLSWCTTVNKSVVHVLLKAFEQPIGPEAGTQLETFVHCLADSISSRKYYIQHHQLFTNKGVAIQCLVDLTQDKAHKVVKAEDGANKLVTRVELASTTEPNHVQVRLFVNLAELQDQLLNATDASFEVRCLSEALDHISDLMNVPADPEMRRKLQETCTWQPRFAMRVIERTIDVPEFARPLVPEPEHYKRARRDLAFVLDDLGVKPGTYSLQEAKSIIDSARDVFRTRVHQKIAEFNRDDLIEKCIDQLDQLTTEYHNTTSRISLSLSHEVTFDRASMYSKAQEKFSTNGKNYRYLLECCLSIPSNGSLVPSKESIQQIIADIDWLLVLYGASDVLHNDIDVAGLNVDPSMIPEVFYSEIRQESEEYFAKEMAEFRLGINLRENDSVNWRQQAGRDLSALDEALLADLGFTYTHLIASLSVLSRWPSARGNGELEFHYKASRTELAEELSEAIAGVSPSIADQIIQFLTLEPNDIRRLLGKDTTEGDVPVWEHNKRGARYAIRPLVVLGDSKIVWGAAAAERASSIWNGCISNGYLPADFDWKKTKKFVSAIKVEIEKELETRTFEVGKRGTKWILKGIDFKYKFPSKEFEDVGDFDVLAYWPESNTWLIGECKYNQPPFCIKDARRLRERIFGRDSDRGQIAKIERRRDFLVQNRDQLRHLLGWPEPTYSSAPTTHEVYVSREIYWWMRYPPYDIPTAFVRVDALDEWLRRIGLISGELAT